MNFLIWLFLVLPFVSMIWLYDVFTEGVKILYARYYCFAIMRSQYLRERIVVDALVESSRPEQYFIDPWQSKN
jgi:hypothetical protein